MADADRPVLDYAEKPTRLLWIYRLGEWVDLNARVIFAVGCGMLAYGIGRTFDSYNSSGPEAMMWGAFIMGLFLTPKRFRS
jgi:hypothetical protein